jgi:dihydrofolate reductase
MRKVMIEVEVSLDGCMGGDDAEFWKMLFPFHTADVDKYLNDLLFMSDALLMGHKTYAGFAQVCRPEKARWPRR